MISDIQYSIFTSFAPLFFRDSRIVNLLNSVNFEELNILLTFLVLQMFEIQFSLSKAKGSTRSKNVLHIFLNRY